MEDERLVEANRKRSQIKELQDYISTLSSLNRSGSPKGISLYRCSSFLIPIFESDWAAINDFLRKSLKERLDKSYQEYNSM